MRIAIEQLQAFEAGSIQIIMNIGGEILADAVFAHRSCTDDGNPSYVIWRGQIAPDGDGASRVTVGWDLHPETFWRRMLLSRIRGRQLRREVPTSVGALARAMNGPTA